MPVGHPRDCRPMGSYNSFLPFFFDFFLVPCSAFFLAADTDFIARKPDFWLYFASSSSFLSPSLVIRSCTDLICASRPSTTFLVLAVIAAILSSASTIALVRSPSLISWNFVIKALVSSSQRSMLSGPHVGPKFSSACFLKSARVRPPLYSCKLDGSPHLIVG